MKAITLIQPWASLISIGEKTIETRSWSTKYRGPLAIHAGKKIDKTAFTIPIYKEIFDMYGININNIPTSSIIAICDITDCIPTELLSEKISDKEKQFGNYTPNRYGWILQNVKILETPIHATGMLGLWDYPNL